MKDKSKHWLIVSYPRSGNTWCRIFISEIIRIKNNYSQNIENKFLIKKNQLNINKDISTGSIISNRNWIDEYLGITSSDLSFNELDQIRHKIVIDSLNYNQKAIFHKVHDAFLIKNSKEIPVVSSKNCEGVLYIVRNPFDLAVSLKHFFAWGQKKSIDFLLDKNASLCGSEICGDIQSRQFLGTWENHYSSWALQNKIPKLIIKYEDLVSKPLKNFAEIASFLNLSKDKNLIKEAIKNTSFKKLSAMENNLGGFKENLNKETKFFRSGKVGLGKKVLTELEIELIESNFKKTLSKLYT